MNAIELKEKIKKILEGENTLQLYLVLKKEEKIIIKLADIEGGKTLSDLFELFRDSLNEEIVNKEEISVCELSTADERPNVVYHYDYEEYPEELGIFEQFDIKEMVDVTEKFNFTEDDLTMVYGYIVYIGSMNDGVVLFKKHYPISFIKRDSFLLGIKKSETRFERIIDEDIIRLNGMVQILKVANDIYITNIKVLERNMGFNKLIYKAAGQAIDTIEKIDILEDIEVLKDSVEDIAYARKLSKVQKGSPIIKNNITSEAIIEFTKNTPELYGKFKYSEDGKRIRLDTKKSKEAFVKLMNDVFLRSELTNLRYEVHSKDDITNQTVY